MKKYKINPKNIIKVFRIDDEANMYIYNLNGEEVLLKLFKTTDEEILEKKRKKIEIMSENKAINDEMGNIGAAIFDGKIVGYFMPINLEYVRSINSYDGKKDKILALKKLREKVEKLNENGVFIGSFDENDILTNYDKSDILLYNLDKCKIDDIDFDINNKQLQRFYRKCSNIENIDSYALNLFTIEFLERIYPIYVFDYLISNELPKYLNTEENRKIVDSMILLSDNYQKKYLIDNIRSKKM